MLAELETTSPSRSRPLTDQARALAVILQEEFGTDFYFFDAANGEAVSWRPGEANPVPPPLDLAAVAADGRARVLPRPEGGYHVALLLHQAGRPVLVATAVLDGLARTDAEALRERLRLQGWLQAVADRLRLADQLAVKRRPEDLSARGAAPWEALLALDQVARRLHIHKPPDKTRQRILEAAFQTLGAQSLVWIPQHPEAPVLSEGSGCLPPQDYRQLAALLAAQPGFRPPGPLWCEAAQAKAWAGRFPSVKNAMAFQVADQGPLGWVVAVNKLGEGEGANREVQPFRKTDAALLTPFVALLESHARASQRYQDLKDLLVGLTRSLTTALDAKDSHTYGHSERVARIAVELGREMGMDGDELGDLYLAGLLHDVGKIGIRDTVLLKPDALTPEEREHIQQHVTIGYAILADLRQIRHLLPGVLYHHERFDGGGYPDGLAGDKIPLLARILAVADSYDAMSNARPYRQALPCRKVEAILTEGMDKQWDRQVVEAFLRCRHRIHTIRQRGIGDSLRLAIEGTLRSEPSPSPGLGIRH
jgi:hypothetical protein